MSFRLEVRPEVDLDVAQAAEWYEARSLGLGREFVRSIRDRLDDILRDPLQPRVRDRLRQVRWVFPRRFPYRIIYGVIGETVIIYAIIHAARRERHWKRRV